MTGPDGDCCWFTAKVPSDDRAVGYRVCGRGRPVRGRQPGRLDLIPSRRHAAELPGGGVRRRRSAKRANDSVPGRPPGRSASSSRCPFPRRRDRRHRSSGRAAARRERAGSPSPAAAAPSCAPRHRRKEPRRTAPRSGRRRSSACNPLGIDGHQGKQPGQGDPQQRSGRPRTPTARSPGGGLCAKRFRIVVAPLLKTGRDRRLPRRLDASRNQARFVDLIRAAPASASRPRGDGRERVAVGRRDAVDISGSRQHDLRIEESRRLAGR